VRIEGDKIAAVGALKPRKGETVIAARGLALAPGFIDAHSHHDSDGYENRDMPTLLAQGVTTIVVGQDGSRKGPLAELAAKYAARPAAINVAAYTGHGFLREAAMGADYKRTAKPAELAKMQTLLADDIKAGSLGFSTGLEYDPGIYSDHAELLDLARTAAAGGGRYISHMRSEDVAFDAALEELLDIGEKAKLPVQISHLKLGIADRWGQAKTVLAKLDAARARGIDVTADVYLTNLAFDAHGDVPQAPISPTSPRPLCADAPFHARGHAARLLCARTAAFEGRPSARSPCSAAKSPPSPTSG